MSNAQPANKLGEALLAETRYRFTEEFLPRIHQCLGELSDDEIWRRPNESVVSVGNLVIHLAGNVRQWIISGLGGAPDHRVRDSEFAVAGPMPRDQLLGLLDDTVAEAMAVVERTDPVALLEPRRVQGREESGVSILVHVTEHFSYHTGQISLHVKLRKNIDLGYYAGRNLNATG